MKKALLLLVILSVSILTSCSDNEVEELLNNELKLKTDPADDGVIVTEDPDDDGEGRVNKNAQYIDKDKSINPNGGGQGTEDDNAEGRSNFYKDESSSRLKSKHLRITS